MAENKPVELTPEQTQMLKTANARGFIAQLVADGIPDPAHPGQTKTCTVEQATELYVKAAKYQEAVNTGAQKVKETIRESLKAEPAKA